MKNMLCCLCLGLENMDRVDSDSRVEVIFRPNRLHSPRKSWRMGGTSAWGHSAPTAFPVMSLRRIRMGVSEARLYSPFTKEESTASSSS